MRGYDPECWSTNRPFGARPEPPQPLQRHSQSLKYALVSRSLSEQEKNRQLPNWAEILVNRPIVEQTEIRRSIVVQIQGQACRPGCHGSPGAQGGKRSWPQPGRVNANMPTPAAPAASACRLRWWLTDSERSAALRGRGVRVMKPLAVAGNYPPVEVCDARALSSNLTTNARLRLQSNPTRL
jgi:hypothetical protein